ncbi:MAG TPA: hypothetical protein VGP26_30850 [Actinophytocola sp.]|nr:hypothetical protein [Actinophytocola sp.]
MDIENLIKETLTAHEHDVPDDDTVLAAARQRIDRRRAVLSRPLAVAAGVVVLTLAAVTVVALNRSPDKDHQAAPADERQVAGPTSKAAAEPAIAALPMPFSLGWLPPGSAAYLARRINIGAASDDPHAPPLYGGEHMLTVTAKGQVLDVDVQQMRMVPVDEAAFKSGPGKPVTINGQRGVESSRSGGPGGYELYLAQPDGGSMYVNVAAEPGSTAPAQQLVDFGRRIARNIRFLGTTTVTPAFGLRDLPAGMRICAFDVERESNTNYSLGTCDTMPPITVSSAAMNDPAGTPGRPVQGHATRHVDENGYRTLLVLDAVDGAPVTVAGRVSLTELYGIANRLVLPH